MGAFALIALAAIVLRRRRRREIALLLGIAVLTTLGADLTVAAEVRYLVPAVPFFVLAGVIGLSVLSGERSGTRTARVLNRSAARPR
jgi:uncharacterized membrane protein YoaK (UPF0700 family)